jgi:hypothetical protein
MASATKPEDVQRLLPWWGKLAHRVLVARATESNGEVSNDGQAQPDTFRASGIRLRAAVDGDAGPDHVGQQRQYARSTPATLAGVAEASK